MTSNQIPLVWSEVEESSALPETKMAKRRRSSGSKSFSCPDSKSPGNSPLTRPAKRSKKDYPIATINELESEIEDARQMIHYRFESMEAKMDEDEQKTSKVIEEMACAGLDCIEGGKNPQNEFIAKSLIANFQEIIENTRLESERDVDLVMEDVKKILTKLFCQLHQILKPKPKIGILEVTRKDVVKFLWVGFWSFAVMLMIVFPSYPQKVFESAVNFYQSATLAFVLFCLLCLWKMDPKSN